MLLITFLPPVLVINGIFTILIDFELEKGLAFFSNSKILILFFFIYNPFFF